MFHWMTCICLSFLSPLHLRAEGQYPLDIMSSPPWSAPNYIFLRHRNLHVLHTSGPRAAPL